MYEKMLRALLLDDIKENAGYGSEISGIKSSP